MLKLSAYTGAGIAALLAGLTLAAPQSEAASRAIYACRAVASPDLAMHSRYEVRSNGRQKFTAEFQSITDPRFVAGGKLNVTVAGVRVGTVTLDGLVGGGVIGDLNFDTEPQIDAKPFPSNWPATVGIGTDVNFMRGTSLVLGCTLARR